MQKNEIMILERLASMASGTIVKIKQDSGYLAGHGVRFIRVENADIHAMARVKAGDQTLLISVGRLELFNHGK